MALLRDTAPLAYYALPPTDVAPYEHVGHFIKGRAPEGAREIDAEEAKRINSEIDSRPPPVQFRQSTEEGSAVQTQLAVSQEMKKLLDDIAMLAGLPETASSERQIKIFNLGNGSGHDAPSTDH